MSVSVVVPLYNKAAYVDRALRSISTQSFADLEIIVVDDGSTDGSRQIAEAFRDTRLRVVSQTNRGPGAARNRGLSEALCPLIAFLDADDEWMPDFLAKAVQRFVTAGPGTVLASLAYIETGGRSSADMARARGLREGLIVVNESTAATTVAALLQFIHPCTTVAQTDALRQYGGFYDKGRCRYAEDTHLWLKVLLNERVWIDFEPCVFFHRDASELSGNLPGARPVEPFLRDPSEIQTCCPAHLKPLLAELLAIRAFKTACVLGYWGDWRAAAALRRHFKVRARTRLPYRVASMVCSTPIGSIIGAAWRSLRMVARPFGGKGTQGSNANESSIFKVSG